MPGDVTPSTLLTMSPRALLGALAALSDRGRGGGDAPPGRAGQPALPVRGRHLARPPPGSPAALRRRASRARPGPLRRRRLRARRRRRPAARAPSCDPPPSSSGCASCSSGPGCRCAGAGTAPSATWSSRDTFRLDPRLASLSAPCFVRGYLQNLGLFRDVLDQVVDLVLGRPGRASRHRRGRRPGGRASTSAAPTTWTGAGRCPWRTTPPPWPSSTSRWDRCVLRVFADDDLFARLMVEHLTAEGRKAEVALTVGDHGHPAVDALVSDGALRPPGHRQLDLLVVGGGPGRSPPPDRPRLVIAPERWRSRPAPTRPGPARVAGAGLVTEDPAG